MSKFSLTGDIGFKRVSAQIRRWVHSMSVDFNGPVKEDYMDCISSLNSAETKARLKTVAPSHAETFQWVFNNNVVSFSTWLGDDENAQGSIYWIQGKPGSGKSTLMRFAMRDSRVRDMLHTSEGIPYVIAGFFFHDRGTLIQKSIPGMLQELLHSTLVQAPKLAEFVQPIYSDMVAAQKTKTPIWDFEALQNAFEAIVIQRQVVTRICLFLDALDEHHGDNEQLAVLLRSLASHADGKWVKIKLCLASRPWDTFTVNFGSCPGFKIHEHTSNDIRTYTLSKLNQASPKGAENSPAGNSRLARLKILARQVTKKAHGVFVWVRIVVEEISKGVRERVPFLVLEEKLSKMPEELKDLYEHTLERIEVEHTEEAYIMLQIALCAVSPLRLVTFVNATSYTLWGIASHLGDEAEEDMIQRVTSRSGGLLEASREVTSVYDTMHLSENDLTVLEQSSQDSKPQFVIQFLHQTVKEYIQSRGDNFGLRRVKSGGCGSRYLMDVSIYCWHAWADDILQEVFEYARRFQSTVALSDQYLENTLPKLTNYGTLYHTARSFRTRVQWWIQKRTDAASREEYVWKILNESSPNGILLSLSLAAGLFGFVRMFYTFATRKVEANLKFSVNSNLMIMATIGPETASKHVPRREMLSVLFELGITPDCLCNTLEPPVHHRTPLALLLLYKGQFGQDESERVSAFECLLESGADPNHPLELRIDSETIFLRYIKQESAAVIRLFGKHGGTVPTDWIFAQTMLWSKLRRQSDVLKEVIAIWERNIPAFRYALQEATFTEAGISGLAALGALTAMGHGASWVFRRHLTAKERWRFAINRTMWLRSHRLNPIRRHGPWTFEDVVFRAMAQHCGQNWIF